MSLVDAVRSEVIAQLWKHYRAKVPDALRIEETLKADGDNWLEDHIAFRTLPGAHTGAHVLEALFTALGYERCDDYHFKDKQLNAFWMKPKGTSGRHSSDISPKIFISELIPEKFSDVFKRIIQNATSTVTGNFVETVAALSKRVNAQDQQAAEALTRASVLYLTSGVPWARPTYADYEILAKESEYAAWTLLFGSQVNHFTVSVHLMKNVTSLEGLNDILVKELKIPMNTSGGGIIKGTKELFLEQSATMAVQLPYLFQDAVESVPYAFIEFAYRHTLPDKKADGLWDSYYQGFVTSNADKIFESTFRQ